MFSNPLKEEVPTTSSSFAKAWNKKKPEPAASSEPTKAKWKGDFGADEKLKQVKTKEKAASSGLFFLIHLLSILKAQQDDGSISRVCQHWVDRIGNVPPSTDP